MSTESDSDNFFPSLVQEIVYHTRSIGMITPLTEILNNIVKPADIFARNAP